MDILLTQLNTTHDILEGNACGAFQDFLKDPTSKITFEDLKDSCERYGSFLETLRTAITCTGLT